MPRLPEMPEMPDLPEMFDESREYLLAEGEAVRNRGRRFWSSFSDFALRDNVLEVAVGLTIAVSFTAVVNSFTSDILLPPLSLLPFINKQLDEKFAVLRRGPNYDEGQYLGYNTLKQAIDDGAVVLAYGNFLDKLFGFFGLGLSLYLVAVLYGKFSSDSIIHETTKCQFCRKWISVKAKRCVNCTSWQDGSGHKN